MKATVAEFEFVFGWLEAGSLQLRQPGPCRQCGLGFLSSTPSALFLPPQSPRQPRATDITLSGDWRSYQTPSEMKLGEDIRPLSPWRIGDTALKMPTCTSNHILFLTLLCSPPLENWHLRPAGSSGSCNPFPAASWKWTSNSQAGYLHKRGVTSSRFQGPKWPCVPTVYLFFFTIKKYTDLF